MQNRIVDVRFASGAEVLSSYWGYLTGGGIALDKKIYPVDVDVSVTLQVSIASTGATMTLRGHVIREENGRIFVAFDPGEPHDMLLTEALAETDDVPARRSRRYRVTLTAQVAQDSQSASPATVTNISERGCCLLDVDAQCLSIGQPVEIRTAGFAAHGRVVWASRSERGVSFETRQSTDWLASYAVSI